MAAIPRFPAARTALLTAAAMIAFAANSLLCRSALGQGLIDAASFTSVRVITGAAVLGMIVLLRGRTRSRTAVDWRATGALLTYITLFSFAYLSLSAGTGALILFGAVQLTMFACALTKGERFGLSSWAGFVLAVAGMVYLVTPGVTAPNLLSALLMTFAGVGWGFYSVLGRGAVDAVGATAKNFVFCVPPALVVSLFFLKDFSGTSGGFILAALSGGIASGCGYVIWYAALPGLSRTAAATVQLTVPALAAFGGAMILSEPITLRLLVASAATLGGVAIVLTRRVTAAP